MFKIIQTIAMKSIALCCFFSFCFWAPAMLNAQTSRTVTGTVVSEDLSPVSAAVFP